MGTETVWLPSFFKILCSPEESSLSNSFLFVCLFVCFYFRLRLEKQETISDVQSMYICCTLILGHSPKGIFLSCFCVHSKEVKKIQKSIYTRINYYVTYKQM